jgi:hypothetical protein
LEEAEDAGETTREAHGVQNLVEKYRSRSKNYNPTTKPKVVINTVEEDGGNK